MERLAAKMQASEAPEAKIVTINDAVMVQSSPAAEPSAVQYDMICPDGDAYRIRLSMNKSDDEKHAKAVLSVVAKLVCSNTAIPDGVQAVQTVWPAAPFDTDYSVLVNKRHALSEEWDAQVDLVQTTNSFDRTVKVERTACKMNNLGI